MKDSFNSRTSLDVNGKRYQICALDALEPRFDLSRLPITLKILLENLLRTEDRANVTVDDIEALAGWTPSGGQETEIAFTPARVLMQDFTGVPAVVDLAAMREAVAGLKGDPDRVNPLSPADLVIDHSVMVDHFGQPQALKSNAQLGVQPKRGALCFLAVGSDGVQ